jgi:hypothetical protein
MKNLITYFLAVLISILIFSCSDSTTNPGNPPVSGTYPNINIKVGSAYHFTNDSLTTDSTSVHTSIITVDTVLAKGNFFLQDSAYMIGSTTKDTITNTTLNVQAFYIKYDASAGKFYQYGAVKLIDSTQTANWDKVADFSVAAGTEWQIAHITTVLGIPGTSADIKSKVAKDTTFESSGAGHTLINAYRIEMTAYISLGPLPIGNIVLEYYIGYTPSGSSNPSGVVRLRLRHINFQNLSYPGFDQKLQTWRIP